MNLRLMLLGLFAAIYVPLLTVGLFIGFFMAETYGYNGGYIVNVLSLIAAAALSSSIVRRRFLQDLNEEERRGFLGRPSISLWMAAGFALIAVLFDRALHALAFQHLIGEIPQIVPSRYLLLFAAYAFLAYMGLCGQGRQNQPKQTAAE